MKKSQSRRQVGDDSGGFLHLGWEGGGRPWLVVILHKSSEFFLIVETGEQMLPDRFGVAFAEAVVKPLVVGIVESLLLHRPLEIPVDFRHKTEAGHPVVNARYGFGPEGGGAAAPGALEHVRQDEHRHVTSHAVALSGNPEKFAAHRLLRRRVAVIKLQRIGPSGKIRVATERDNRFT